MKKYITLTESQLKNVIKKVINEQVNYDNINYDDYLGKRAVGYHEVFGGGIDAVKKMFASCNGKNIPPTAKTNKIADEIYDALAGFGTNEDRVFNALKSLSGMKEFCSLNSAYKKTYGKDLFNEIDADMDQEQEWTVISKILRNVFQSNSGVQAANVKKPSSIPSGVAAVQNKTNVRAESIKKAYCSVKNNQINISGKIVSWNDYVQKYKVTPQEIQYAKKFCPNQNV